MVISTRPCSRLSSKGVFLERERRVRGPPPRAGRDRPGRGRPARPWRRRPVGKPEQPARGWRSAREAAWRSVDARRRDRGAAPRTAASPADGAVGGLGEGPALAVGVLRIVADTITSMSPLAQRLDHGRPVVLGAQRRPQLEEGAVGADVVLVQGQMVDRDAAGHRQPACLGGADRRRATRGRRSGRRDSGRRSARRAAGRARA